MAARTVDLGFLLRDVRRQRELAQRAFDEGRRIDDLCKAADVPNRAFLEETRNRWLKMAGALAENAYRTSTIGSIVVFALR